MTSGMVLVGSEVLVHTGKSPIHCHEPSCSSQLDQRGSSLAFHSLLSLAGNVVFSDVVVYPGSAKMSHHETKCAVILVGENSSALCQQCSKTKSSCTQEIKYPILCPVTSNASALSHAKISIPQHHSDQNKSKEVCRLRS